MENIIILILFTYPGIMADYIHERWTVKESAHRETTEFFRTARDFFLSAAATLITMTIFSMIKCEKPALTEIMKLIQQDANIWIYLPLSMVTSFMMAGIWYGIDRIRLKIHNRKRLKDGFPKESRWEKTWTILEKDNIIPFKDCVLAVYSEGQLIRAGMAHHVTEDPEKDPWIALKFMAEAEEEIRKATEDRIYLKEPAFSFVNVDKGTSIEIYDSRYFAEMIDHKYKFTAS